MKKTHRRYMCRCLACGVQWSFDTPVWREHVHAQVKEAQSVHQGEDGCGGDVEVMTRLVWIDTEESRRK